MKKAFGLFVILLLGFGIYSYNVKKEMDNDTTLSFSKGDHIESFTLPDMNGRPVSLDSVLAENRYVWVNFWASWCGPCRREMPMMAEVFNEFKGRGLSIVAVNVGEDSSTVRSYLSNRDLPFTILRDRNKELSSRFNVQALPTSFLVDSTGVIQRTGIGIQDTWDYVISNKLEAEK